MKSFLLLVLSLMTGCEASPEVKGCKKGWAELTCKYPNTNKEYQNIKVDKPRGKSIQSTKKDVWEEKGRFSLYHDTKNKNLRMVIKQLEEKDSGKYKCEFDQDSSFEESKELELKLETVKDGCQTPFTQTAYETAKTTITCDYPKKYNPSVTFFCKDNKLTCEEILSTQSSVKSNGTFTLTDTNRRLNMAISNLSSQHAGVYWCGVKSNEGYRASLRKIQLEIKSIKSFKTSPTIGQNFTYWCDYTQGAPNKKFICKGEDPSVCQPLWSTSKPRTTTGKFSMKDDKEKRNITITVRNITTNDTGTYWCGAENKTHSNPFFHKMEMTVEPEPGPVSHGDFWVVMIICIAVLLLLLLLSVILISKRFSYSKNTRNGAAAQHIKEDYIYEEVQERPQNTGSGNATANLPTDPSASLHYSTIVFQPRTDRANGEELIPKPSSSTCEYSTASNSQSEQQPIYSTVYKPPKTSENPR